MLRYLAVAAVLAVGTSAVYAQNADAIKGRQAAMKALSAAAKEPGGMMKGEIPFDLAKVQASLTAMQENTTKAKGLFGADAKTGADHASLPVVWEKKADFDGKMDKLVADAKTAAGAIKDEASFKAEWGKVMSNCGACHKEYRKPN